MKKLLLLLVNETFSIALSSIVSASSFFSLPFSSLSAFSRLASEAEVSRLRPGLLLPQNPDDLLFREPTCLHVHPQRVTDSIHFWRSLRGSGHCIHSDRLLTTDS
jgi:hypothetical protein